MDWFEDILHRRIRLTDERKEHIETDHPEMLGQIGNIRCTLANPEHIIRSNVDANVEMFYRYFDITPVTKKYLCIVVKVMADDHFIVTAYFTDTIKRGEMLWGKM